MTDVAPIQTADAWEIKTKYTYNGGGATPCIFGYSGNIDCQNPSLLVESDVVKFYTSSNGATWDIFSSESMALTLTSGNTYYLKLSYDSVNGYKFEHSTDDVSYTTSWTSATTTKSVCNTAFMFLNLGLNSTVYYSSGSIDLSETVFTIDSSIWWEYLGDSVSFKVDDGTLYAPLTIVSADGTETTLTSLTDLDLSSLSDGRINIFVNSDGAVAYNNTIFCQVNQPTPTATNDIWFNNLDEAKKWNGSAWVATDLVFLLAISKNGILEYCQNAPAKYNGIGEVLVENYLSGTLSYEIYARQGFEFFAKQKLFTTILNGTVGYQDVILPLLIVMANTDYFTTSTNRNGLNSTNVTPVNKFAVNLLNANATNGVYFSVEGLRL